jgi:hypothetical protein
MPEPAGRGRSVLRIPRVEFDLKALVLGAVLSFGYAAMWGPLASLLAVGSSGAKLVVPGGPVDAPPALVLRAAFFGTLRQHLPIPGLDRVVAFLGQPRLFQMSENSPNSLEAWDASKAALPWWGFVATAAALLLLWSIVGGAIARTYALRKARDESVRAGDALAFSLGNLRQSIQAPVFALAAGALFVALALACGAAAAVPYAGPVLQVVAHPLAFLAALVTAILGIGLVLGFPLFTAAVAVERNGSLDAVSRTFSYVWSRPVTFAVSALLVLAVAGVAETVAAWVLQLAGALFTSGARFVDEGLAARLADSIRRAYAFDTPSTDGLAAAQAASVWVASVVAGLAGVLARGFVVSYLVGGVVDVYFLLREEVDLIDPSEVYVEGEPASLGAGVAPAPAAPASGDAPKDGAG